MIVCICHNVTERDIRAAVNEGVESIAALRMATGCSGTCGQCADMATEVFEQAITLKTASQTSAFPSISRGLSPA